MLMNYGLFCECCEYNECKDQVLRFFKCLLKNRGQCDVHICDGFIQGGTVIIIEYLCQKIKYFHMQMYANSNVLLRVIQSIKLNQKENNKMA